MTTIESYLRKTNQRFIAIAEITKILDGIGYQDTQDVLEYLATTWITNQMDDLPSASEVKPKAAPKKKSPPKKKAVMKKSSAHGIRTGAQAKVQATLLKHRHIEEWYVAALAKKANLSVQQLYNVITRLKTAGDLEIVRAGVWRVTPAWLAKNSQPVDPRLEEVSATNGYVFLEPGVPPTQADFEAPAPGEE